MRALVWEGPRVMGLREQPKPQLAPNKILLKVTYSGICGSDLSGYLGHNAIRTPPLIMGHEFSGTIIALGEQAKVLKPGLSNGQEVTVNPILSCGSCEYCRQGSHQLCHHRNVIGAHQPGAFAEYISVPASCVIPVPEGLSLRLASLAEPAAVAVRIAEFGGPLDDAEEAALILGAGPIGLLTLQALQSRGSKRVFVADLEPARLGFAETLGGIPLDPRVTDVVREVRDATRGRGVSVSVDAVGTGTTRLQCVAATRSAGKLILSGLREESSSMPVAEIIRREIRVLGSFAYSRANFADALAGLARRTLSLDPWIVEAPLAEGDEWFERLLNAPGAVAKVLLVP